MRTNGTNTSINFDTQESKTLPVTSAIVTDEEEIRLNNMTMAPTIIKRPKTITKNNKNLRNKSLLPHHLLLLNDNTNTKGTGETIRGGATNTTNKGMEHNIIINNQSNHHRNPSPPQITHIRTTMWRMLEEHYSTP
jgi:hypothetical protein